MKQGALSVWINKAHVALGGVKSFSSDTDFHVKNQPNVTKNKAS